MITNAEFLSACHRRCAACQTIYWTSGTQPLQNLATTIMICQWPRRTTLLRTMLPPLTKALISPQAAICDFAPRKTGCQNYRCKQTKSGPCCAA